MLIKYEFEILSYISGKSIQKSKNLLYIPFSTIKNLDSNIEQIISNLENLGILYKKESRIEIYLDAWINKFVELLNIEFKKNKIDIECYANQENQEITFNINGSNKNMKMAFNEKYSKDEDLIFMCPTEYDFGVYWLDLLNDVNTLYMFYSYLTNEINRINIYEYKQINIFEGIDETHVSEIFNVSIKNYFKNKSNYISDPDKETIKIIKNLLRKDEINCYMIQIDNYDLILIKDNKIIKFLTFMNYNLVYVREIDDMIMDIRKKLTNKVSSYRKLMMFRDNKVIDNSIKLTNGASVMAFPTIIIFSILGVSPLIENFKKYDKLLFIIIILLIIIQAWIVAFLYIPAYKLGKFKWDI